MMSSFFIAILVCAASFTFSSGEEITVDWIGPGEKVILVTANQTDQLSAEAYCNNMNIEAENVTLKTHLLSIHTNFEIVRLLKEMKGKFEQKDNIVWTGGYLELLRISPFFVPHYPHVFHHRHHRQHHGPPHHPSFPPRQPPPRKLQFVVHYTDGSPGGSRFISQDHHGNIIRSMDVGELKCLAIDLETGHIHLNPCDQKLNFVCKAGYIPTRKGQENEGEDKDGTTTEPPTTTKAANSS